MIHRNLQMLEFGAGFKKARESQNVSIDKIAEETRISKRFLMAIENEHFDVLPGGIFNRGFIRTYAERLGLDPEAAIRSYEKISQSVAIEPGRLETDTVRDKTTKIPVYYFAIAALLISGILLYVWTHRTEPPLVTTSAPSSEPPAANTEETPAPEAVAITDRSPASEAAAPVEPVVIELEVREASWFRLSSDGALIVVGEVLPAGTSRRYTANNSMDVGIGNAAGVEFRVNGQPVSSLGRSGEVRTLAITAKTSAASLASK